MAMPIQGDGRQQKTFGIITGILKASFNKTSATKEKVTLKFPMVTKKSPCPASKIFYKYYRQLRQL